MENNTENNTENKDTSSTVITLSAEQAERYSTARMCMVASGKNMSFVRFWLGCMGYIGKYPATKLVVSSIRAELSGYYRKRVIHSAAKSHHMIIAEALKKLEEGDEDGVKEMLMEAGLMREVMKILLEKEVKGGGIRDRAAQTFNDILLLLTSPLLAAAGIVTFMSEGRFALLASAGIVILWAASINSAMKLIHQASVEVRKYYTKIETMNKYAIRAVGDKIAVSLNPRTEKTDGGIVLAYTKASNWGTVVSVGNRVADITEGDQVFVSDFQGTRVEVEGHDIIIMDACKVLAKKED